jgi:hypothetical protein
MQIIKIIKKCNMVIAYYLSLIINETRMSSMILHTILGTFESL